MINTVCTLKNLNGIKSDVVTVKNVSAKDYLDKYFDVILIGFNGETIIVDTEDMIAAIDKCSCRMSGRKHIKRNGRIDWEDE